MFKSKVNMQCVGCMGYNSLTLYGHICWRKIFEMSPKRPLVRLHSGLWREGQWWSWWRAAVLSTYTVLSQSLSSLRAKPWITETRWVFCFNKILIITHDFMEMIHGKPYTSLRAKRLSCSQNSCVYTTSARGGPQQQTDTQGPSEHLLTAAGRGGGSSSGCWSPHLFGTSPSST